MREFEWYDWLQKGRRTLWDTKFSPRDQMYAQHGRYQKKWQRPMGTFYVRENTLSPLWLSWKIPKPRNVLPPLVVLSEY